MTESEANATYDHIAHSPSCSIEKAERLLGYAPRYTSLQAVQESVQWLMDHGVIRQMTSEEQMIEENMKQLITTLGSKSADELGLILPHEHIFVDLGPIEEANYRAAQAAEVIAVMAPQIEAIKKQGITALVECTPEGVGRRADIDRAVSEATDFPVVMPTGIYREPWVPQWAHEADEDALVEWLLTELTDEIGDTGVQAAWIKVSAGDDGITPVETKILRAAARAGAETGAIIGSHTIRGTCRPRPTRHNRRCRLHGGSLHLDPYPGRAGHEFAPGDGSTRGVAGV